MRFRLPFDDVQFNAAVQTHARMRVNLKNLRRQFPPRVAEEESLLRQYRNVIQDFARELQKPFDRINPARLNDLNEEALLAFVAYAAVRGTTS